MLFVSYLLVFFLKAKTWQCIQVSKQHKASTLFFLSWDWMSIIYSNGLPSVQSQKRDLVDCVVNKEMTKSTWYDTPGHTSRILLTLSFPQRAGNIQELHVWFSLIIPNLSLCITVRGFLMYKAHNMKWQKIVQDSLYH